MKNLGFVFIFGMSCGAIAMFFLLGVIFTKPIGVYNDCKQVKTQCEEELPRNQYCVITAKPEEE